MQDAVRLAILVGMVVFGLMIVVPVATFVLRAAVVALLAGLAVFVLARLLGR